MFGNKLLIANGRAKWSRYLLLLAAVLLPGCGGGGGSGTFSPAQVTTMLALSDSQATHSAPQMSFNAGGDGVALWTVTSGTETKLLYSTYDAAAGSWSVEQVMDGSLAGTINKFRITTNGSGFMAAWAWSDARGHSGVDAAVYINGSWGAPTRLDDASGSQAVNTLFVASDGNGYGVTWVGNNGATNNVYGAVYDGAAWQSTTQLDSTVAGSSDSAVIASNGSGYAVAWSELQSGATAYRVFAHVYANGTWSGQQLLSDAASTTPAYTPSIASNGQGYAAAWFQGNDINAVIYAGSSWGSVTKINSASSSAYGVKLAASGADYAAVWYQFESSTTQVYANNYDTGSGFWLGAVKLSTATAPGSASSPVVAANGGGFAAMWLQSDGSDRRIAVSQYATIGGWSTTPQFLSASGQSVGYSFLTATANGYAVFWTMSGADGDGVYADRYSGGAWESSNRIDAAEGGTIIPDLFFPYAVSGDNIYFAWQHNGDGDSSPRINAYHPAGGWGSAFNPASGAYHGSARVVKLLRAADGGRAAIWIQYDHGNSSLYASF